VSGRDWLYKWSIVEQVGHDQVLRIVRDARYGSECMKLVRFLFARR
jgi:hypothetical protein